jgi:micrococcal nuclease
MDYLKEVLTMVFVGILGFLLIIFALLYLIFHFIRKLFTPQRFLSKRLFYSTFIGGLILLSAAMISDDTGAAAKLEEEMAKNTTLTEDVTKLKTQLDTLTAKVTESETVNVELEKEKAAALSEKDSLASKIISLESEVSRLTEENKTIVAERDSLNEEVASLNSTIEDNVSSSSLASFDETESVASEPSTSYGFYDNCAAAQAAGAAPVYAGDPGYGPHLDHDDDGVGCEY